MATRYSLVISGTQIQELQTGDTLLGSIANITGGSAGQVHYQSAANTTGFTAAGTSGQYLQSTGTGAPVWSTVDALPSQTSNSGKFLTTNGTTASWGTVTSLTGITNSATPFTTALGYQAANSTTGTWNVAVGYQSLYTNSTGNGNVAIGTSALYGNTTGSNNVAISPPNALNNGALYINSTGSSNIAIGLAALRENTTANNNVAIGQSALNSNTTGSPNVAVGYQSLIANTTGSQNNAVGSYALYGVTTGTNNTAIGYTAGYYITTGSKNTIIGGYNGNNGGLDIRTASNYIVLSDGDGNPRGMFNSNGYFAASPSGGFPDGTNLGFHYFNSPASAGGSGDKVVYIRADSASFAGTAFSVRGNRNTTNSTFNTFDTRNGNDTGAFIIRDSGNAVNTNNSYGSISDISLKENIVDATPKLAALNQVQVRSYNLKAKPDEKHIGVIAQELETVFPGLVETDNEGIKNVKYSVFVPMLIKAVQELTARIEVWESRQ